MILITSGKPGNRSGSGSGSGLWKYSFKNNFTWKSICEFAVTLGNHLLVCPRGIRSLLVCPRGIRSLLVCPRGIRSLLVCPRGIRSLFLL